MLQVVAGLLALNTVFIVLIFVLFRSSREEWRDVSSKAKAYYEMARTRESRANRAVDDIASISQQIPSVVKEAIHETATNGGSGVIA